MGLKIHKSGDGLIKSILLAHLVLFLHLFLFAALGLLVVFLSGMMQYMLWILLGGMLLVGLSGYLFFRRLSKEGRSIGEILRSPIFRGRTVEVSLLGGMATLKLDSPHGADSSEIEHSGALRQLEDPETARIREISALAQLVEKQLISPEEFIKAKQRLLGP
jgi:hypothetical protein